MFIYSARLAAQGQQAVRDLGRLTVAMDTGRRELLERAVSEVAIPAIRRQFETAGSTDPWAELSEATVARRERQGLGDQPLVATGQGLSAATSRDRWTITRREAAYPAAGWTGIGSHIRHHQEGTRDGHVPGRPFARLEESDTRSLDRVGLAWVDGIARRAGF